jgi:hypothetical protein
VANYGWRSVSCRRRTSIGGGGRAQDTVEPLQATRTPDAAHVCGRDSQPLPPGREASVACARADLPACRAWVLRLPEAHAIGRARWITGGNAGLESPTVVRAGPAEVPRAPLGCARGTLPPIGPADNQMTGSLHGHACPAR